MPHLRSSVLSISLASSIVQPDWVLNFEHIRVFRALQCSQFLFLADIMRNPVSLTSPPGKLHLSCSENYLFVFFFIIRHKIYRVIQLIFIHILDISYCVSRHTQRRQKKLKTNLVLRIILTAKHSCMGLLLKDNDQIFYLHILSVQTCRLNDCLLDKWTNDSMSIHWILSYSLIQQTFIELCLVKIMAKS